PVPGELGPGAGHGARIDLGGRGHRRIRGHAPPTPAIAGQQDAGPALVEGGGRTAAQQRREPLALVGTEDDTMLGHSGSPCTRCDPWTLASTRNEDKIAWTLY